MEILTEAYPLNRWDKDSIRPGPVGSVGDVNLQVKLKKSAPYLPNRYDARWSGGKEVWSGSNVSDGMWTGYTSGGRGAVTLTSPMGYRQGFKTAVGWIKEDLVPADRSRIVKTVPLGKYDWESETARIYKSKVTGEQFLPLPMGYEKTSLPRGSQIPIIVAESSGLGIPLPAAEVKITDPVFGEQGKINIPMTGCDPSHAWKIWTPASDSVLRAKAKRSASDEILFKKVLENYPWRASQLALESFPLPTATFAFDKSRPTGGIAGDGIFDGLSFHPCGTVNKPSFIKLPAYLPKPTQNTDRRKIMVEEKRKKQKMM